MVYPHFKIHFSILILITVFAVSFAGPPEKNYDEFDDSIQFQMDSLDDKLNRFSLDTDSLLLLFDTLDHLEFNFEELNDLPGFPEIIIDENGVIKVLTDTGFVVITGNSFNKINNLYTIDDLDYNHNEITEFSKDIIIDEGERLATDIILIKGDVTVNGTVEGDIVVVGGNIYVNSTGYIRGDAIAVLGRVKKEEGGRVNGSTVSIALPFIILPYGSWVQVFEGILTLILVTSIFFSALAISLFPKPINRISSQLYAHPIKSFFFGHLLYFGAFLIWLLLLVSFIGLPLAILQPIAMIVMAIFGYASINVILGERLFKSNSPIKSFFLGTLITTAIPFILLVTGYISNSLVLFIFNAILLSLLLFVLLPFGLGAALLARFGLPKKKKKNGENGSREITIQAYASDE